MKKNQNIPLNYRERNNSRIALICSVAVLVVLVLFFHQLDYVLIQKPQDEAARQAEEEKAAAELAANTPEVTVVDFLK